MDSVSTKEAIPKQEAIQPDNLTAIDDQQGVNSTTDPGDGESQEFRLVNDSSEPIGEQSSKA